ncbi:hypothetical protein MPSEU_000286000 [Mayamaea pseudoterrestris]|nr:hypothetical protein MPSEU_000286000 [Mayamaea pseudoterrestris]
MPFAAPIQGDSYLVTDKDTGVEQSIQTFSLSLENGVCVKLSSLGASVTHILLPSANANKFDDIVLGYKTPLDAWHSGNPAYFGCIVGRVANRIRKGELKLNDNAPIIQLEINNDPNHLHGGIKGFGYCIWDAQMISVEGQDGKAATAVRFSLVSPNMDQHYPGALLVTATYSLQATDNGAKLRLEMDATQQANSCPTPVNLAQHVYLNLARHDDPQGVLDHKLKLYANSYTPIDASGIPTREVVDVADDPAMDWTKRRLMRNALVDYGHAKAALSKVEANDNFSKSRVAPDIAVSGSGSASAGTPYGFDHNYIIVTPGENECLSVVGILEHEASQRRLTVRSDAPGVQLYTANYLDGVSVGPGLCKDNAVYRQWQGVCLETQSFPDSILVDAAAHFEFYKGKCKILTPDDPRYTHTMEYEFELGSDKRLNTASDDFSLKDYRGSDTHGRSYESTQEMWESQGVYGNDSSDWYHRAADYYEEHCDASLDGVLGGFAEISESDLKGSLQFIQELQSLASFEWSTGAACECGAGIGRVTKGLLLPLGVPRCDLVESSSRLISAAPDYIGDDAGKCRFYCCGLQDWEPASAVYSLIWIQWVLCYLTDQDAIRFLQRCASALVNGGYICVKENTCVTEDFVLDVQDASVTRSVSYLKSIAMQAGLVLVKETLQTTFPSDIYPVPMLAFQNKS